jgi:LysR family glycine cleavage system transcriptional activator
MARRLPPMNTLRAFEAAGRLLSFTRAAEELHVTQAAISHQIKNLETSIGVRLFRRLNRALLMTEAGQRYLPAVRDALDALGDATNGLTRTDESGVLMISTLPSFAATWLVPRLTKFRTVHPEIDILISASDEIVDLVRDDLDMGIRYGSGTYAGLRSDRLLGEEQFIVCNPRLVNDGLYPLREPDDLRYHTLLHDEAFTDWQRWLGEMGVSGANAARGPTFNHSNVVIEAAIDGQGVALARSAIAAAALADGRLVKPFDISVPLAPAYYVVSPWENAERAKVVIFRDWLLAEAAAGK